MHPLVSRDHELATLRSLCRSERGSVITIVGPAGGGKTSIARELVHSSELGATIFVDAIAARTLGDVAVSVARSIHNTHNDLDRASVAHHLADLRVIVIDGVDDHALRGIAGSIVLRLGIDAPKAIIVFTSRERLDLSGETVVEIEALSPPTSFPRQERSASAADGVATSRSVEDAMRCLLAIVPEALMWGGAAALITKLDRAIDEVKQVLDAGVVAEGRGGSNAAAPAAASSSEKSPLTAALLSQAHAARARLVWKRDNPEHAEDNASEQPWLALASECSDAALEGRLLAENAMQQSGVASADHVNVLFEAALQAHVRAHDAIGLVVTLLRRARFLRLHDRIEDARRDAERALDLALEGDPSIYVVRALAEIAFCLVELDDDEAPRWLDRARVAAAKEGSPSASSSSTSALATSPLRAQLRRVEREIEFASALFLHARGSLDAAEKCYQQVLELSVDDLRNGDRAGHVALSAQGYLGIVALERGDDARARAAIDEARSKLSSGSQQQSALFDAYVALIDATSSTDRRASIEPTHAMGDEGIEKAMRVLRLAQPGGRDGDDAAVDGRRDVEATATHAHVHAHARRSADLRIALRVYRGRLTVEQRAAIEPNAPDELIVAVDGTWFEGPRRSEQPQPRCHLSARTFAALLVRLTRSRVESPNTPVAASELVAVAWPNEKIPEATAQNRLRVALAGLRKAGLRDALITTRGGYMIDPTLATRFASPNE